MGTTTKDYFYLFDSSTTANIVERRETFLYNDDNFQIAQQDTYLGNLPGSDHYTTKYYYPVGGLPPDYSGTSQVNRLVQLNKVNEVLAIESYKNGELLSRSHNRYSEFSPDLALPSRVRTAKGSDALEDRIRYHRYDSHGNPEEVSQSGGARTSYIWGYNGTYPVAKSGEHRLLVHAPRPHSGHPLCV